MVPSLGRRMQRLARHKMALTGSLLVWGVIFAAVLAPLLTSFDPNAQHIEATLQAPGPPYWFGTDQFGRDILSRVLYGGRVSVYVGLMSVLIGATIGVLAGTTSGFTGGWTDVLVMRPIEFLLAFPAVILGIALAAIIGQGTASVISGIGIYNVPIFARLSRAATLTVRRQEFVEAAVAAGASSHRILRYHILGNIVSPILIQLGISFGIAIIIEAGLSYLGLGVQPPDPSWGSMLRDAQTYLNSAPWFAVFPGLALALLVIGVNLLIEGTRNIFDPRQRTI
jgi:peptide/nickel transport system permease protein